MICRRDPGDCRHAEPLRELFRYHVLSCSQFGAISLVILFDQPLLRRIHLPRACRHWSRIGTGAKQSRFIQMPPASQDQSRHKPHGQPGQALCAATLSAMVEREPPLDPGKDAAEGSSFYQLTRCSRMKHWLCSALVVGLAACADYSAMSAQQATNASTPSAAPEVCERATPTGSNLSVTRCAHPATASDHMDARDAVRTLAGPGAPAGSPNGH